MSLLCQSLLSQSLLLYQESPGEGLGRFGVLLHPSPGPKVSPFGGQQLNLLAAQCWWLTVSRGSVERSRSDSALHQPSCRLPPLLGPTGEQRSKP